MSSLQNVKQLLPVCLALLCLNRSADQKPLAAEANIFKLVVVL